MDAQPEEDQKMEDDLLTDQKELAEHIMLVDLGRNDVGRVAKTGSVNVEQFMNVERYSHVMHIVSQVTGELHPNYSAYDVMKACFPAGTLSGAPKIRAMQIIEELEPTRRGPYGGAVGYFSFSGNMDTCINIRTVVAQGQKGLYSSWSRNSSRLRSGSRIRRNTKQSRSHDASGGNGRTRS